MAEELKVEEESKSAHPEQDAASTAQRQGAAEGQPSGSSDESLGFDRLVDFFSKWASHLTPESEKPEESPPPLERRFSFVLLFLKILPWLTGLAYIVSLWWDFRGPLLYEFAWRSEPVVLDGLLRMLAVCGLVGFGTNWLAIKMLFYPRKRRPLLGQGLIPSRKDRIVLKLGESISKEIINAELILQQIRKSGLVRKHRERLAGSIRTLVRQPEFRSDLLEVAEHYLTGFLRSGEVQEQLQKLVRSVDFEDLDGLEGGLLRLYRFFKGNEDLAVHFRDIMKTVNVRMDDFEPRMAEYLDSVPTLLEEKGEVVEDTALKALVFLIEQVNVKKVIIDNLGNFDEIRLERLLMRSTSDQLQYIQYLGCLLGIIGGLFIWQPVESIVVFATLGFTIWGLDTLIVDRRKKKKRKAKEEKERLKAAKKSKASPV